MITPESYTDYVGSAILAAVFFKQMFRKRRIAGKNPVTPEQEVSHDG